MDERFESGDAVLVTDGRREFYIVLKGGMIRLGGFGALDSSQIIGKRPGEIMVIGSRELLVIRPDLLDTLKHLERGPQTILPKDSSSIVMGLGLRSGMRVLEGGAGSGGLTIALLNAVAPGGSVTTYELREDHMEKARGNVERSGLEGNWTAIKGDVREAEEDGKFDAFVVDIPDPENTVGTARRLLGIGGRYCSYVPTSNQLERIFIELENGGFTSLEAYEVIRLDMSVKKGATRPATEMLAHTGYLVFGRNLMV